MSYLQSQNIIKYLLITLVLVGVLYFLPSNKLDTDTIVKLTLVVLIAVFVMDNFVFPKKSEGMDDLSPVPGCSSKYRVPKQYSYGTKKEDYIKSGLSGYDYDLPGYYLINNGAYSSDGIDYSKVDELICDSKYNHLYQQHNFNILFSPHTHIGKARGYMNWDKTYD